MNMKKVILAISLALAFALPTFAEEYVDDVEFEVRRGLQGNKTLSSTIEKQTTKLLTILNKAQSANSDKLDFKGVTITSEAQTAILQLWKYNHMRTYQADPDVAAYYQEDVTKTVDNEYEVRNIQMAFTSATDPSTSNLEEVSIQFDAKGTVVGFCVTMASQQYTKILSEMEEVMDEEKRNKIIKWMENMCTAYNSRDLSWFQQFFSDDVLVITGSRRYTTQKGDNGVKFRQEYFEYVSQNKTQYLTRLEKVFKNTASLKVKFDDDFIITAHPLRDRYYAVELTQRWTSSSYSDVGRLFVVWDFGLEQPQILLRAWTELDDEKHFGFNDLDGLE
jgi:hypothetical protein